MNRRTLLKGSLIPATMSASVAKAATSTNPLAEKVYRVLADHLLLLAEIHKWPNPRMSNITVISRLNHVIPNNNCNDYFIFMDMISEKRYKAYQMINVGVDYKRAVSMCDYIAENFKIVRGVDCKSF